MAAKKETYAGGAGARYWLLGSALFLSVFGLVMIYSASSITAMAVEGSSYNYLVRQLAFIIAGGAFALFISNLDYRVLQKNTNMVWAGTIGLLLVVLVIGFSSHGAQRWIPLGFFNLQPSELAKVACILAVSAVAVEWQRGKLSTKDLGYKSLILTVIPSVLIISQPDMGTTATLIVAVVIVLILAGVDMKWVVGAGTLLVAVGGVFIFSSSYRMERVLGFLNPWADPAHKGYQIIQALYAFGSGGVGGLGLGMSRQKFFYLPEAHTDFILAIIGEEAGVIGTVAVVVAFGIFIWAGFRIAAGAKDRYGKLVAGGITGMLAFQALINMAAVTGMMPVTGKPLPFVSYGGSSMLVTMIALGFLLSVSRYGGSAPRAMRTRPVNEEVKRESSPKRRGNGRAHISGSNDSRQRRRRA